jgi:hypothetical protein
MIWTFHWIILRPSIQREWDVRGIRSTETGKECLQYFSLGIWKQDNFEEDVSGKMITEWNTKIGWTEVGWVYWFRTAKTDTVCVNIMLNLRIPQTSWIIASTWTNVNFSSALFEGFSQLCSNTSMPSDVYHQTVNHTYQWPSVVHHVTCWEHHVTCWEHGSFSDPFCKEAGRTLTTTDKDNWVPHSNIYSEEFLKIY